MSALVWVPVCAFNRWNVTRFCLPSLFRPGVVVTVWNDHSTDYGSGELANLWVDVRKEPQKLGIHNLRLLQLREFLRRDEPYLYLTDSDALHDPDWLERAGDLMTRAAVPVTLYNSDRHVSRWGVPVEEYEMRPTAPGISQFLSRAMVERAVHWLDANEVKTWEDWDYGLISIVGGKAATSLTSYVEHLGVGGMHSEEGEWDNDRAINPTPWLVQKRQEYLSRLMI